MVRFAEKYASWISTIGCGKRCFVNSAGLTSYPTIWLHSSQPSRKKNCPGTANVQNRVNERIKTDYVVVTESSSQRYSDRGRLQTTKGAINKMSISVERKHATASA